MRPTRWMLAITSSLLVLAAVAVMPLRAANQDEKKPATQANKDILAAVPADAMALVCIRNVGELDRKLLTLSQKLNVPPMSMLQMAKAMLQIPVGVDDNGSLALVLMPTTNLMMAMDATALLVPCSDYAALTSQLQPTDVGEGVCRIVVKGEESFAAPYGAYAVIGPSPQTVKALLTGKDGKGIGSKWAPHQVKRFETDDFTVWINMDAVISNPAIQGLLMMVMAGQGPEAMEEIKAYQNLAISLRLAEGGLGLGIYIDCKEGTDQARAFSATTGTKASLLQGLPKEDFIVAAGMRSSKEASELGAKEISKALSGNPMLAMQFDAEKLKQVGEILSGMFGDLRGLSFSISSLPDGSDGLIGMVKVVTFEKGAKEQVSKIAELIQLVIGMAPVPAEQAEMIAKAVQYTAEAEMIGSVKVDHLAISLDQIPDVEEEWLATMKKIVGKEGILFRIAAVDDKRVIATFGGGKARAANVIKLAKGGDAPLGTDENIKRVAAMLPEKRVLEGYLALGQLASTIDTIGKLVGSGLPIQIPPVATPLAMTAAPAGKTGYQVDIAFPMDVISAAKDVIMMSMMGGAGGPPPGSVPGGPPTDTDKASDTDKPTDADKPTD